MSAMFKKLYTAPSLRNVLFVLLLIGIASGIGHLASRYKLQRDITQNASNSLEPGSVTVLKQMSGPITIVVYATEQDARLGDIRKLIREFVSLYQRYKPDLKLTFVDPEKEPEKARAAGIQLNGEMVVSYAGRSEHLTQLNEQVLTAALLRLAHTRDQTVMYLDGHGERKLDGAANHDLGELFGAKLKQNGFRISSLNLALAQEVPDNVGVLVVTQPQVPLLPGETDKLLRYIERGGNLLWLVDAEPLRGLEPLAERNLAQRRDFRPCAENRRDPTGLRQGHHPFQGGADRGSRLPHRVRELLPQQGWEGWQRDLGWRKDFRSREGVQKMNKLKFGIPKGSLEKATINLFEKSGWKISVDGRSYFPDIDDETLECTLCRAQEMSRYVENGTIDAGLTGKDWIEENESDVVVVDDLVYSKVSQNPARWVLAVAADSDIKTLTDV